MNSKIGVYAGKTEVDLSTVLQGKRAKLLIFQHYGHNFLLFSFQATPLGI